MQLHRVIHTNKREIITLSLKRLVLTCAIYLYKSHLGLPLAWIVCLKR